MSLVRFRLWPLKRHHRAQPLSVAGQSLLLVCSQCSAGLASSSVPSSVPTGSACDVAHREKDSTTKRNKQSGVNTSSAERLPPSAGGCEDNDPSIACEALLDDADDAASPLLSTALRPTSRREARSGQLAEQPTPKEPPPKSASAVAMEEFAALERKLAAGATPKPASHAAATPPKKSAEQVAMEEFAALERKLGGVDADPVRRTKQDDPRKARLSLVARPKEPEAEECCGNGCSNCVWIDYWNELQDWEEAERQRGREKAPP